MRCVEQLRCEVGRMRQRCHHRVDDVLLRRSSLQGCLDATASQLSGVRSSIIQMQYRLHQLHGRSATRHFLCESLISASFSLFVNGAARLVSVEVEVHRARVTNMGSSSV